MDPDMIRPRKCKPCPPPPPPSPSPKKEEPPPPPHGEHVAQACQHDCYEFRGHPLPFLQLAPPSPWPCHLSPQPPPHVRNYWNDDLERFSRMRRVESLEMGYRMNFRDPLDGLHENNHHTLRRLGGHHQCHGPPPMLTGHHRYQPPPSLGYHRGQPPLLLGNHREPPTPYFPQAGFHSSSSLKRSK
ncbi:hypothetical protein RDI58_019371 [Solanum bulbocastanum]|uniref:Uncharacterized protein n=1 Tax=Solanum bulbocastanum TaxID=147425 RepID=A0AAN8T6L1_SOLBU